MLNLSRLERPQLNLGAKSSLHHLSQLERTTTLRYMLFYSDDFVSDSSKMKAQIKFDHEGEMMYDQEVMLSPKFRQHLINTGLFFDVDVSPMSPSTKARVPQHSLGFSESLKLCEEAEELKSPQVMQQAGEELND